MALAANANNEFGLVEPYQDLPANIRYQHLPELTPAALAQVIGYMRPDSKVQAVRGSGYETTNIFRNFTVALGKGWERERTHGTFYIGTSRMLRREERHGWKRFSLKPVRAAFFEAPEARELFLDALYKSPITDAFARARNGQLLDEWLQIPTRTAGAITALWPRALVNYEIDGTFLNAYMPRDYGFHYHSFANDMKDLSVGDREKLEYMSGYRPGFYINFNYTDDSTIFMGDDGKTMIGGRGWNWNIFTTIGHRQGGSFHTGPIAKDPKDIQRSVLIAKVYPDLEDLFPANI